MNEYRCRVAARQLFCPRCKGTGQVCTYKKHTDLTAVYVPCLACAGTGRVEVQELRWARGRANAQTR